MPSTKSEGLIKPVEYVTVFVAKPTVVVEDVELELELLELLELELVVPVPVIIGTGMLRSFGLAVPESN